MRKLQIWCIGDGNRGNRAVVQGVAILSDALWVWHMHSLWKCSQQQNWALCIYRQQSRSPDKECCRSAGAITFLRNERLHCSACMYVCMSETLSACYLVCTSHNILMESRTCQSSLVSVTYMYISVLKSDPPMFTIILRSPQIWNCYKCGIIVKINNLAIQRYCNIKRSGYE